MGLVSHRTKTFFGQQIHDNAWTVDAEMNLKHTMIKPKVRMRKY